MVKQIQGWQSEVTGEILDNQREAELLDNQLLAKYNGPAVDEHIEEVLNEVHALFKNAVKEAQAKGDKAEVIKYNDLYQAAFDSKVDRSNKYYGANPLDVLAEIENLSPGILASGAVNALVISLDAKNAAEQYELEKEGGDKRA